MAATGSRMSATTRCPEFDPTGLDVGNAGNDGFNKQGDPIVLKTEQVYKNYNFTQGLVEHKSDRGQTAQRIEALANGGLKGSRLVNQKDLEGKVTDWDSACHFLSIAAGPQAEKGQYFTVPEVEKLINKFQTDESLGKDMNVIKPSSIENEIARELGYQEGSVSARSKSVPSGANATVRRREPNGHSNLGDSKGAFKWESWDGGSDHIPTPSYYYGLYFK